MQELIAHGAGFGVWFFLESPASDGQASVIRNMSWKGIGPLSATATNADLNAGRTHKGCERRTFAAWAL